jgi:hypothetical protein
MVKHTTLASRATTKPQAVDPKPLQMNHLKHLPRIATRTFEVDWQRYALYQQESGMDEKTALRLLPLRLDDDLFRLYTEAIREEQVSTLLEARAVLARIAGVRKVTVDDLMQRKWKEGVESLSAYMYDLRGKASELRLPESVAKVSFLAGIPQKLNFFLKMAEDENESCVKLAERAEKLMLSLQGKEAVQVVQKDADIEELRREIATLTKEVSAVRWKQSEKCFEGRGNREVEEGNTRRERGRQEYKPLKCFQCGKMGHIRRFCPKNF